MYSHRRFSVLHVWCAAVVTAALLVGLAGTAAADPRDDKKRIDAEVAKASSILEGATERAQDAARSLADANSRIPEAEALVVDARGQVVAAQVQAETARRRADESRAALDSAKVRFVEVDARVQQGRQRVADFVVATYKGGGVSSFNALIGAPSPSEAMTRYGYVSRIVSTEREAVRGYLAALTDAKEAQGDATRAQNAADNASIEADAALDSAELAQDAADDAADDVAELVHQREAALQVAEEEKAASLGRYEEAKAEAARIEAAVKAWEEKQAASKVAAAAKADVSGATLLVPVRGRKSSDFGNRFNPVYHVWQLHAGVDLAAGGGQPIYAAADGEVIMAGWKGGYGNYTCISHGRYQGKGLSTCYAHQSRMLVSAGQRVRRGQVIGRVGTTGASTGNHLHFEVRLNGTPVQPLSYLPKCLC